MAYWATYIAGAIPKMIAKELISVSKTQLRSFSKDVAWSEPDYIHFTTHFLGWLTNEEKIKVKNEIATYGNIDIILTQNIKHLGWKASENYLTLEVEKTNELMEIYYLIKRNLALNNVVVKEQEFIPHITLGRFHPTCNKNHLNTKLSVPTKISDIKLSLFRSIEKSKIL
ncbi:MAG: hypothetical protein LBE13_20265 [Bacteroidales bacterium]|jgi:2'-5' RNA ligase|nr:hypothetical protein [Bacteroidales bacterium]